MRKARFYDFGPFRIDRADRLLLCKGAPVQLTPKVFDTLLALVENSNRLVEKADLMEAVWPDSFVAESSLTFNISVLRKALTRHDDRQYIETVPRRGYRFVADVKESSKDYNSPGKEEAGSGLTEAVPKTIAILPFRSLIPDIEYQYLGLGMADVLIAKLGSIKQLLVRPTSAVVKYDNLEQDPVRAGHELGVESVLEGIIRRLGERLRVTVQLDYYLSHWCLGYAYIAKGSYEEAIETYQKARTLSGGSSSTTRSLGHLYALLGKKEEAYTLLNELKEASQHRYVSPYDIAGVYAGLGENAKALEWLENACCDHAGALVWIKIDNTFKSLRSEPGFRELLKRINLGD